MDDFNQGSENFAEEGLEGVKNAGHASGWTPCEKGHQ